MPKAIDIQPDGYNQILLKGGPGFGKTLAAATFALEGPIHISYFDKKKPVELISFFTEERFGDKAAKILNNIEYTVYGSQNAHEYLNRLISMLESNSCRLFADITDSTTSLTAAIVNWSLGFQKDGKSKVISQASDIIPDFDEYKCETSLVTQALDIYQTLPCHVIWIAHPLPSIKIEGTGRSIKVTKTNPIVTYGTKVAGIIPGRFTEIYHMYQETEWDTNANSSKRYKVSVDAAGDDFAKSSIFDNSGIKDFDITDKLFYEVWKENIAIRFKKKETE